MVVPEGYIEGFVCTLATCDVKLWGYIHYQPSMIGNVLFLVLIDVIAVAQLWLGIKYSTGAVVSVKFSFRDLIPIHDAILSPNSRKLI